MVEKYWTDASSSEPLPPPEQYDAFKGFKAPKPDGYKGPVPVADSDKRVTEQSYERPQKKAKPTQQVDFNKTGLAPLSSLIPQPHMPKLKMPTAPRRGNRFDLMDLPSMQMHLLSQDHDDETLNYLMGLDPTSLREYLASQTLGSR